MAVTVTPSNPNRTVSVSSTPVGGSQPRLQGGGTPIQGSSPKLQGSSNTFQTTLPGGVLQPAAGLSTLENPNNVLYTGSQAQEQPAPTADPWASTPWGSYGAYTQAISDYNASKNAMNSSISDSIKSSGDQYKSGIMDFIDSLTAGQKSIDRLGVQNELGREQGRSGVLDMVGTGIRSGGVMLNNYNATNSSAGEQLGKAWGEMGRKEMSKVGNKYVLDENNRKAQQETLNSGVTTFKRHAEENKVTIANGIVSNAASQIAALNAAAASASLPERLNIESEKERIRSEALMALAQFDNILADGISKTAPASTDVNRAEAYKLANSGVAPEDLFSYTSSIPDSLKNTGPFATSLPLFTGA